MDSIVLSTRVRLARNLNNYPFIPKLNREDAKKIINDIENTVLSSNEKSNGIFKPVSGEELKNEGGKLIEKHLISPNILNSDLPSSVIMDNNNEISIMINEEDHLRIQVIKKGYNLKDAYNLASVTDDLIEEKNEYAFSEKYGYLTSCPTNVGTGMRASVMLHLPAISLTGRIGELIESVNRLGITVRGYYGEGSKALGNIYQFSNQVSLGLNETEILNKLENIVKQIAEQENELRKRILNDSLKDKILRSYGILSNCYLISFNEFLSLWSNILLGLDLGILTDIDKDNFKTLIYRLAPGSLNVNNSSERDKLRAELLRECL